MNTIPKKTHDWAYYKHLYITGGEAMTLDAISQRPNAPSIQSLKAKCGAENWLAERRRYTDQVNTRTREIAQTSEAEVSARHVKIAQMLQAKALQALSEIDPTELPPSEVRQFLATAADIERKALGMDNKLTLKGVGDVSKLSDEQLLALARTAGLVGDPETGTHTA